MNTFTDLNSFIDLAEKNRKYPENTAHGLRAALKVFSKELKPDEFNSIALIEERFDQIFLDVLETNKDKYSIDSLNTYKMRFMKVLNDYKRYGADPSNIQNWVVKNRKPIQPSIQQKDTSSQTPSPLINYPVESQHKIELALRPSAKAMLLVPADLTQKEAETLKSIIDSLAKKS